MSARRIKKNPGEKLNGGRPRGAASERDASAVQPKRRAHRSLATDSKSPHRVLQLPLLSPRSCALPQKATLALPDCSFFSLFSAIFAPLSSLYFCTRSTTSRLFPFPPSLSLSHPFIAFLRPLSCAHCIAFPLLFCSLARLRRRVRVSGTPRSHLHTSQEETRGSCKAHCTTRTSPSLPFPFPLALSPPHPCSRSTLFPPLPFVLSFSFVTLATKRHGAGRHMDTSAGRRCASPLDRELGALTGGVHMKREEKKKKQKEGADCMPSIETPGRRVEREERGMREQRKLRGGEGRSARKGGGRGRENRKGCGKHRTTRANPRKSNCAKTRRCVVVGSAIAIAIDGGGKERNPAEKRRRGARSN